MSHKYVTLKLAINKSYTVNIKLAQVSYNDKTNNMKNIN